MRHYHKCICENGHIVGSSEYVNHSFCQKCGGSIISACRYCKEYIRESMINDPSIMISNDELPYYCCFCGKPYPWTEKIISNAYELVWMDESLDDEAKKLLVDAIPNLLVDTPDTKLSTARYSSIIKKAQRNTVDMLKQLLVEVVIETVKIVLFKE